MPLPSGVQLIVCGTRPPTRSPRGLGRLIMSDVLRNPGAPQRLGVLYICTPEASAHRRRAMLFSLLPFNEVPLGTGVRISLAPFVANRQSLASLLEWLRGRRADGSSSIVHERIARPGEIERS